jgi:hypothetical protein
MCGRGIMNRFVEEAMNGRREDVVLPFPSSIFITQEMKPNNLIKRLRLPWEFTRAVEVSG